MKNKKLLICGNFGAKNIGDELILLGLQKIFEGNEIKVLSESKKKNHYPKFPAGIRSFINFLKNRENLKALKKCDYFLLGGGNLFAGPSKKANYIWGIQSMFAMFYKKPIIIFGQSIGDNHDIFIRLLIKFIFKRAKYIFLRDLESKKELEKIGIKREMKVLSDPAFILETKAPRENNNQIILALRQKKDFPQKILEEIKNFLSHENKENILINFETGQENDEILHKQIPGQIKNFEKDPIKVLDQFKKADLAICMRLHAVIVAIITETPFIGISYAKKVKALIKYANLEELCLEMNEIKEEHLIEKKKYIEKNKDEIIRKMKDFKEKSKGKFLLKNFPKKPNSKI